VQIRQSARKQLGGHWPESVGTFDFVGDVHHRLRDTGGRAERLTAFRNSDGAGPTRPGVYVLEEVSVDLGQVLQPVGSLSQDCRVFAELDESGFREVVLGFLQLNSGRQAEEVSENSCPWDEVPSPPCIVIADFPGIGVRQRYSTP
ncbi:hypothetical protein, partial [Gordonia sp. (in: high G+C Gram-positive bacteria)]|uniref:hypothetical protein n=1 Tax=Gordonia sp. (in: high G+C Gram-positive bacteria) TaxID=84139 RepID=UPI003C76A694